MSLDRPLAEPHVTEHRVATAAPASFDQSRELDLAAVAHLSRRRSASREHTGSDLRVFFTSCHSRQLAPLTAQRHGLELFLRWPMQDARRSTPFTVSRRLSVVAGFSRTCVVDGVLDRRPFVIRCAGRG